MSLEFTDESFQLAMERVIGARPDDLLSKVHLGTADEELVSTYGELSTNLPEAQKQIAQLAIYATTIDNDCLSVLSELKPITQSMELNIRLCSLIKQVAETARNMSLI